MENQFREAIMRKPLDAVMADLQAELHKQGFQIVAATDFVPTDLDVYLNPPRQVYKVLSVIIPFLYDQMLKVAPFDGIVVPCAMTVIERPGEVALIPLNPMEYIAAGFQNPSFHDLSAGVSRRLGLVIHALEQEPTPSPDLITSWS